MISICTVLKLSYISGCNAYIYTDIYAYSVGNAFLKHGMGLISEVQRKKIANQEEEVIK